MKIKPMFIVLLCGIGISPQPGVGASKVVAVYGKDQKITHAQLDWQFTLSHFGINEIFDMYARETNPVQKKTDYDLIQEQVNQLVAREILGQKAIDAGYLEKMPYKKDYEIYLKNYYGGLWNEQQGKQTVTPTPGDIYSYYSTHLAEYSSPAQYELRYLYVRYNPDKSDIDQQYTKISTYLEMVKSGVPFEKVARDYSESENSAQGGRLGWVQPEKFKSPVKETIQALTTGQLSPILDLGNGYHVFYCEGYKPASPVKSFEGNYSVISSQTEQYLRQKKYMETLAQLKAKSSIQTFINNIQPSSNETTVIALVNHRPIRFYEFTALSENINYLGKPKDYIVNELINQELIYQDAERLGLTKDPFNQWKTTYWIKYQITEPYVQENLLHYQPTEKEMHDYYDSNSSIFLAPVKKHTYWIEIPFIQSKETTQIVLKNRHEAQFIASIVRDQLQHHYTDIHSTLDGLVNKYHLSLQDKGYWDTVIDKPIAQEWYPLKEKSVSNVIDRGNKLVLLFVDDTQSGGLIPYESIAGQIKDRLIGSKLIKFFQDEVTKISQENHIRLLLPK